MFGGVYLKNGGITPQEMASLHELLSFKSTCAVKTNTFGQLANDERLKKLLEQDAANGKQQLRDTLYVLRVTNTVSKGE
jgi:hypothetical protein